MTSAVCCVLDTLPDKRCMRVLAMSPARDFVVTSALSLSGSDVTAFEATGGIVLTGDLTTIARTADPDFRFV